MWNREPAVILAAVQAVLALVIAFGLDLTNEQTGAVLPVCRQGFVKTRMRPTSRSAISDLLGIVPPPSPTSDATERGGFHEGRALRAAESGHVAATGPHEVEFVPQPLDLVSRFT